MIVYAVINDFVTNGDRDNDFRLFDSYEKANEYLLECAQNDQNSDWFLSLPNPIIQSERGLWVAYQRRDFLNNHSCYRIAIRVVE